MFRSPSSWPPSAGPEAAPHVGTAGPAHPAHRTSSAGIPVCLVKLSGTTWKCLDSRPCFLVNCLLLHYSCVSTGTRAHLPRAPMHSRSSSKDRWVDGSQSGICKQLVLSVNPSSAASQALVSANHWASEPCTPCCSAQKAIQGRARWRRGLPVDWGVEAGRTGLAPEAGPTGAVL